MLLVVKRNVNRIFLFTVLATFFTNTLGIIGHGRGHSRSRGRGMSSHKESDENAESAVIEDEKVAPVDEVIQKDFSDVFDFGEPYKKAGDGSIPSGIEEKINEIAEIVKKDKPFSDFRQEHLKAQDILMDIFREKEDDNEFLKLAKSLKSHPKLNFALWLRAFVMVSSERSGLVGLAMPQLFELIPQHFIGTTSPKKGRGMDDNCHVLDEHTGSEGNDPEEQKLWYFREDLILNVAHWMWHVDFPFDSKSKPDRRGEIFNYFHHNLIARYAAERLSVGLKPVEPLELVPDTVIEEGYDPHLGKVGANLTFGARPPKSKLPGTKTMIRIMNNLMADLETQELIHIDGSRISTKDHLVMDTFGNLLEGTVHHTINKDRYLLGGLHNLVHYQIAAITEVEEENFGVMLYTETAVRDPIFYRWHTKIEKFFDELRKAWEPYEPKKGFLHLWWCTPDIQDLQVRTLPISGEPDLDKNTLQTQFKSVRMDMNHTVAIEELNGTEPLVSFCVKLLTHRPFEYKIVVNSNKSNTRRATVRIFMAPRFDHNEERFSMEKQRVLYFPMDEFIVHLAPGKNTIVRSSLDSLLTAPAKFEDSYSKLRRCGCGYPNHLLVPRGTKEGMIFDLFVMITDGKQDLPENYRPLDPAPCYSSHIVCGRHGERYPDARPMGYPFDRRPYSVGGNVVANIDEFVKAGKNMKTVQIKVIHNDNVE